MLPDATLAALATLIALPFLCVTLLRLVALREAMTSPASTVRAGSARPERLPDRQLPVYTVLVPLFRETKVLPGLIQSLRALDYPAAKLEIMLVLEAVDLETQAAVLQPCDLPGNFRTLVVPDGEPQTKPKALNYALQFARGDFVVVYDAEDRPEPDQLRRALGFSGALPPELGCLQAQLNIYNPRAELVDPPVHHRVFRPLRRHPARAGAAAACRCRWAARRTISRAPRSLRGRAPGIRST